MIWAKTEAGRAEMQRRALVTDRQQRTLLLLIDGAKTQELLLASLAGLTPDHFKGLLRLGLIEEVHSGGRAPAGRNLPPPAAAPAFADTFADTDALSGGDDATRAAPSLDYGHFTARLTQLISRELGLRGFPLTLAVEKAGTIEELLAVGRRVVEQIRARQGEAAAEAARQTLFG